MKEQILPRGVAAGLTDEQVLASRRLHGRQHPYEAKKKGFFSSISEQFRRSHYQDFTGCVGDQRHFPFPKFRLDGVRGNRRGGISRHLCFYSVSIRQRIGLYRIAARFGEHRMPRAACGRSPFSARRGARRRRHRSSRSGRKNSRRTACFYRGSSAWTNPRSTAKARRRKNCRCPPAGIGI